MFRPIPAIVRYSSESMVSMHDKTDVVMSVRSHHVIFVIVEGLEGGGGGGGVFGWGGGGGGETGGVGEGKTK